MKYFKEYQSIGVLNDSQAFEYLVSTFKETIRTYDFFVAWGKVLGNVEKISRSLHLLNSIIGKEDIEYCFKSLINDYPEVVSVIPILIAERSKTIKIAEFNRDIIYDFKSKKVFTSEEIDKITYFAKECGILKIISEKNVTNLNDYVLGVEVGLDSNARKNRSGTTMENLVELYINDICERNGFQYLTQASTKQIFETFGKVVRTDKENRRFDFVVNTPEKVYLLEVNYYGSGGFKLKSVAGEFVALYDLVVSEEVGFIWVTDGKGWLTAKNPLKQTFEHKDHIINISMINSGILEDILVKNM